MKNQIFLISIITMFFLAPGLFAQSLPPVPATTNAISATDAVQHISFLAADSLEGRGTGTRALDVCAEYLAREYAHFGLQPLGENGSYMQSFEVVTGIELGANNSFALTRDNATTTFTVDKDYRPIGFTTNSTVSGPVAFVGYGLSVPTKNYDDYEGIDVSGKVVLAMRHHPEYSDPHSEMDSYAGLRSKAAFAREAKALALLLVNPEQGQDELVELKFDNSRSRSGIPIISISRKLAEEILKPTGKTLGQLRAHIDSTKKPASTSIDRTSISLSANVINIKKNTSNVIAFLPGSDPVLKNEYIVVGAHYDHLGWGQDGSLYRGKTPMVHNGADDNASGVSGCLELAEYFAKNTARLKRSLVFINFSGEEMGLLGSRWYVDHPTVDLKSMAAMINLDMIGRMVDSTHEINAQGIGTSPVWKELLSKINEKYNFSIKYIPDGTGPSDHASFYNKNIPTLFFFTGLHSDYHKPSDDVEKINGKGLANVIRFTSEIIRSIDNMDSRPTFTKVKTQKKTVSRFKVYVGTIPDYGADVKGFKISGVSDGSPAEKAGLKGGDIILKFGDMKLLNIYDYMTALSHFKAGDEVPVVVNRGGKEITLTLHLEGK